MLDSRFTFAVEARRAAVRLGVAPASLAACAEDAYFRAVLSGEIANDGKRPPFTAVPIWAAAGPPTIAGLRLTRPGAPQAEYGLEVFTPRVRALIADLVQQQVIAANETVTWSVLATETPARPPARFRARAVTSPYPFIERDLPEVQSGTLAVTVDAAVLDRVRARVAASPTVECAGLLAGYLIRDRQRAAAELRVAAELPVAAGRGGASSTHFAFGPDSFRSARALLAQRGEAWTAAGWVHSHPACENCARNPTCTADTVFLSVADAQVHAAAFPARHAIALVAGKISTQPASNPGFRLFAWEQGTLAEQPFAWRSGALCASLAILDPPPGEAT